MRPYQDRRGLEHLYYYSVCSLDVKHLLLGKTKNFHLASVLRQVSSSRKLTRSTIITSITKYMVERQKERIAGHLFLELLFHEDFSSHFSFLFYSLSLSILGSEGITRRKRGKKEKRKKEWVKWQSTIYFLLPGITATCIWTSELPVRVERESLVGKRKKREQEEKRWMSGSVISNPWANQLVLL